MKLELKQVHVDQVMRFFRKGSILGGTIKSGSLGIEVQVDYQLSQRAHSRPLRYSRPAFQLLLAQHCRRRRCEVSAVPGR